MKNDFAVEFSRENASFDVFIRWYLQIDSIESFDVNCLYDFGFDDDFPFKDLEVTGVNNIRSTIELFGLLSAMWFINPNNVRLNIYCYDNGNIDEVKIRWTAPNGVRVAFFLPLWDDKEYNFGELWDALNDTRN